MTALRCEIDHLIVACGDLGQGAAWLEARLGEAPQLGGKHALMGTHNMLLRLGARIYLELIAIDPDAPAPQRPEARRRRRPKRRRRSASRAHSTSCAGSSGAEAWRPGAGAA